MAAATRTARKSEAAARRATSQPAAKSQSSARKARSNGAANGGPVAVDERALKDLLRALESARRGDFSVKLSSKQRGLMGDIANAYNDLVDTNARMTKELVRVGRVIGREGRMTERAQLGTAARRLAGAGATRSTR